MRQKIVAGNWKMNCDLAEMEELLGGLKNKAESIPNDVKLMVAPSYTNLYPAFQSTKETPITVVAQNMHQSENGAFTGEVSPSMLKSVGVETVILGHSERRAIFHESDELLVEKVNTALKHKMNVIFCFGEELKDRKSEKHFEVVKNQLKNGLFHIDNNAWENIVLAYEPVWAIGTGETASPEQAQEMHAEIRKMIAEEFNQDIADKVSILYGGSVKPANAKEIFAKEDVDGGLIGGASLKADDFLAIANSY
ncbi:triose-phosphate isomerase [Mesonia aestuariivivens]|uniref:Triosephosphate isomerase n=1 Tax=Mesonia aestuariivivens TaxID=2796128 RepID=A0ABS6VZN9_9FLAO|nr:triose-phosphate isomerase [Mesonia aestuariivivens]MBW2961053.1 triose-phosphate isomerase [Mesonia aestuariivivens]